MIRTLLLTFIPLFVAVDVVAVVFVYLGIGMPLDEAARRRLVLEATMTAAAIGLGFLLVGDAVLHVLGVTAGDFQAAGGVLLLVLSSTISSIPNYHRQPGAHLGVVPLGIPMIVGPATLTTLLTLARTHGYTMTPIAFALNLVIAASTSACGRRTRRARASDWIVFGGKPWRLASAPPRSCATQQAPRRRSCVSRERSASTSS